MGLLNERARVLLNDQVGPRLFLMRLEAPRIAADLAPGQFVHLRIPDLADHVLRRPFSVYDCDRQSGWLDLLYQTVGRGTEHMSGLVAGRCGDAELIGPVGRPWSASVGCGRALLVGGGVGAAPLFLLCKQLLDAGVEVQVVLGAQTKDALVCRGRFDALLASSGAAPARCATDDGSFGRAGFCTSLVEEALRSSPLDYVAACGPTPLLRIVASQARDAGVPCQVSLETRMACGVGACLSCVVDTTTGKQRVCVDGPVFDAEEVVWA